MPHRSKPSSHPQIQAPSRPHDVGASNLLRLAATLCATPVALLMEEIVPGKPLRVLGFGLKPGEHRPMASRCLVSLGTLDAVWIADVRSTAADPQASTIHLRHLAAVRLFGDDGRARGVLCVAAPDPRPEDPGRLAALRLLSQQWTTMVALEDAVARADAAERETAHHTALVHGLLEAPIDATIAVDRAGRITHFSTTAERMLGLPAERAIGAAMIDLLVPEPQREARRRDFDHRLWKDTGNAAGQRIDMEALRADGSVFPVEIATARCGTEGDETLVISLRDTSEQKRANARAEADLRAKTDFLSRLSHDIRTPLNGIVGLSDLSIEAEDEEDRAQYLRMMRDSAYGLLETVNSILDYSKIDSFGIEPVMRSFSPQTTLTETLKTLTARAREKGLDFRVIHRAHDLGRLIGDPGFLRQIASNLVGNAIRFTEQGHVRVTVRTEPTDHGRVAFTLIVDDSGIGIPDEQHERIFEAFTQAHDTIAPHRVGTGLGLAIVRRLVDAMHGTIELESSPGNGSRFTVHLEFEQDVHGVEESATPAAGAESTAGLHVLVVDDNDTNRLVAGRLVARNGFRVSEAASGPEAIEIATRDRPALVLMDLRLPGMNGLETMAAIRALPDCAQIPAIALTAHALVGDREHFLMMGMEGYVSKPFSAETLLAEMDRVLGMVRVRRIHAPGPRNEPERFARLIDSLDGNPRLFAIIARKAAQEFRDAAERLPQQLKQRDWPALIELVHRLKGSWPLYAAPAHAMLADRCMGMVTRRNAAGSREPLAAFCTALRETAQELDQWLENHRRTR